MALIMRAEQTDRFKLPVVPEKKISFKVSGNGGKENV